MIDIIDPIVIGIGHKKGVGKDTVASRLVDSYGFIRMSFADPLKDACRTIFHFTDEQLYGKDKETIDPRWNKTPRQILQLFGTEALRQTIDPEVWIKSFNIKLHKMASSMPTQQLRVVVPDTRFENEAEAIRALPYGYLWKVERTISQNEFSNHASETALDNYPHWDTILTNNTSMADLYQKVTTCINEILFGEQKQYANNRR